MRILVDAIPFSGLLTGISRYLRNLYGAMEALDGPYTVEISYFNGKGVNLRMPPVAEPRTGAKRAATLWKLPDPAVFTLRCAHWLWYEQSLRRVVRKMPFDLYHETAFTPAAVRSVPEIYSLYDLSLLRYPETHPRERVWFFEFFKRRRMHHVTHILTLSQYVREEICHVLGWPLERVTAIPLAPAKVFRPKSRQEVAKARTKFCLPDDYLLFVGSMEPRKNIGLLMKALQICRSCIPLVLVGWEAWGEKGWLETARSQFPRRIFLLGYVDDETLASLYSGAAALVYPSLYEGFGLPILEAMACGCPVICSNAASMPEVAGGAARLVDPRNPEDLAAAIDELMGSTDRRKRLTQEGLRRAAQFSWERTARQTAALFRKVLQEAQS